MSLVVPTVADDLVHPAATSGVNTALETVVGYVDAVVADLAGEVSSRGATTTRADGVRAALLSFFSALQAVIPDIEERFAPMADLTDVNTAISDAITALEAC